MSLEHASEAVAHLRVGSPTATVRVMSVVAVLVLAARFDEKQLAGCNGRLVRPVTR